jgi:AcrR family transcriptional regulator
MAYPAKTNPEEILKVALELLEQEGGSALSMRNLAERLNMKAPSLYRHFADKEALEVVMGAAGADLLRLELEKATDGLGFGQALIAVAYSYLEFARKKPELYALMMNGFRQPVTGVNPGKDLWNFVLNLVSGVTQKPDDTAAAVAFWSFLHGFSVLERSGMFGESGPKGGLEVGLAALLKGLSQNS